MEDTHLKEIERVERFLSIVMIAFSWAFLTGIFIHQKWGKIRILKHGRRAKSFLKYGLEYIDSILLNTYNNKNWMEVVNILSCT